MSTIKELYKEKIAELKSTLEIKNIHEIPKLEKIVINRGLGEAVVNPKAIDATAELLYEITGQKPVLTTAKKSISNFKIREGQVIGSKVTIRSDKMYDFLTKLINISLPRIRDFRGVSASSFDGRGNYTLGIKDDSIFPEAKESLSDKQRGLDVTFVTNTDDDNACYELLLSLGMPFRTKFNKRRKNG